MRLQSRIRVISAGCAVTCAALMSGCQEPISPSTRVDGLFVLRTVGTIPLPAVTDTIVNTQFIALADTIVLRADGSGEQRSIGSRHNLTTDFRDTTRTVLHFDYRRRGASVRATEITCEPLCDFLGDSLEFRLEGEWLVTGLGASEARFERVGPGGAL